MGLTHLVRVEGEKEILVLSLQETGAPCGLQTINLNIIQTVNLNIIYFILSIHNLLALQVR